MVMRIIGLIDRQSGEPSMIDLRSDLMSWRPPAVAVAASLAASRPPAMAPGEDPYERKLYEVLSDELGVEAVLLMPTCTMANQIAIRVHLPEGGQLAAAPLAHILTVEARATALTRVGACPLPTDEGHPSPAVVDQFLQDRDRNIAALVWLENTHMLSAGSVIPVGWQSRIAAACREDGSALHLDGSRLWNAAAAQGLQMTDLTQGCDTVSISLNKAIGAPVGSVLAGSREAIDAAVRWRQTLGGEWRPIGTIAAAAIAALDDWRVRLETDLAMTASLVRGIANRLGEESVRPAPTNLIFLNRVGGDAPQFVEVLTRRGVQTTVVAANIVRLAIHSGVREREVAKIIEAVTATYAELEAAA
ncbi:beta-eliminating lyase-related protein [Cupriavidus basilensis]|uniref:Beta-eliminating lyase-related protein n=1 Tax=Cupriavidus basilensis TaxID=68895 RepID=A0ABT6ATW5_9BURK|nr:beta-eliminating lyase-related protein [Cupriavidus basilensis]MDF3835707.1 beta-eliminating lyase-related protein [Cupriavidus basilensis]